MNIRIKDICRFGKKSDIKAGEGNTKGKYMFFTSSIDKDKRIDKFDYDEEGIIMGTGGNATLHYYSGKFAVSTDCLVLLPNSSYKCKYLYYFFLHNMRVLEGGFRGAGLKHTSKSYIENIELTKTHSLLEQDKIISVLSNIDNTIVLQNKRLKLINELTSSLFIEMFGDLKSNSKKWIKKTFTDIASIDTNMINVFDNYENYPHIGIESIEKGTGEIIGYRTVKEDKVVSGKYLFTEQHIIYSKIRPNLNKVALPKCKGVCSADAYPILVKNDECHRVFLAYTMRSKIFLDYIIKLSNRTNLPKVNKKQVEGFICPVPPLDLQNRFADYVSSIDKSKYSSFSHLSA